MDDHDLTDRLHRLGAQPVPDDAADRHHRRMAAVVGDPGRRFGRLAVAGAALVGFAFGSTGLAMAGALPDPAQDVAHDVLAAVQVDVPESNRGQCVSAIARDPDLSKEAKQQAKRDCPKGGPPPGAGSGGGDPEDGPGRSGEAPGRSGEAPGRSGAAPGQVEHADDPCRGKPPWAGNKDLTDEERAAMQAERDACPPDPDDTAPEKTVPEDTVPDDTGPGGEEPPS